MQPNNGPNTGPNMGFGPLPSGYQTNYKNASPQKKRIALLFVVGVAFIGIIVAFSILGNRKDPAKENLVKLAIAQKELIRLSENNEKKLIGSGVKRHNEELQVTMETDALILQAELKRAYKIKKISAKDQKAAVDKRTDDLLVTSAKLNRLDEDFSEAVAKKLAEQMDLAQQAQGVAKSQQTKTVLTDLSKTYAEMRSRFAPAEE